MKRSHRVGRELALGLFFVALSVAMTWPLGRQLGRAVHSPADPYVSAQIIDWDLRVLSSRPGDLFHLPVFHPSRHALAFTEHLLGIAMVVWPLHAAGASAVTLHNVALILGFAFCGYGALVLGRLVTGSTLAGIVAGIFYAFLPYRFHHASHISYVWSAWLPLLLAAAIWYWRRPSWKRAAAVGGAFLLNGLTCLHWLAFGSLAFAATLVMAGAWSRRLFDRRWVGPVATSVVAAVILLAPTLVPYRTVARLYQMERSRAEAEPYSGRLTDWLMPPRENAVYGEWSPKEKYAPEHPLFPGFTIFALVLSATLLASRRDFSGGNAAPSDADPTRELSKPLRMVLDLAILAALAAAVVAAARGQFQWGPLSVSAPAVPLFVAAILLVIRSWRSLRAAMERSKVPVELWMCALWIGIGFLGSLGLNAFFTTRSSGCFHRSAGCVCRCGGR